MDSNAQTQHALVAALKELYLELGRPPTRGEFENYKAGAHSQLKKIKGGYTVLLQAAGLPTYNAERAERKIDNSIFAKSIEAHLDNYEPEPYAGPGNWPTFAIISDIHWPFACQRVIDKFYLYVLENQPEWVILNGDAWDMYSHAKFPRSHNVFTPREEQRLAREANEEFWKEIKRIAPRAKCVQMLGNHDVRPLKRILEVYPEAEDWIADKHKEMFTFDGVTTMHDPREVLYLAPDVGVCHGFKSQLGAHRDSALISMNVGHTHRGGSVFRMVRGRVIYETNSGYAGDPLAKGLTYTPSKINDWTPGFAAGDKWGSRFIPA